ncbi:TfoX/Sxy family protein [Marinobacter sp. BGYM27]|uniref:TfoX/Sxy family protein n=1 Tax=Marinobacter sp. BGYM27 TaxID=2975597 RepID=UPI0021A62BFC|nr:TfoX/Sxy family protein [Marinobacter sp. BGYM27]MDG5500380.1 TfoX/Sxy family protein [Marinobacter sp. BGYM27]|tara:strand:- start:10938 stop:11405 length:468 start_codon:yes stop_codon:yes gene_type:complete
MPQQSDIREALNLTSRGASLTPQVESKREVAISVKTNPKDEFAAFIVDQMQSVGPAVSRRMFGGHGVYLDGLMFALVSDNTLYLKVDSESRPIFENMELLPFTFERKGKAVVMSYFQAPDEVMESPDVMQYWASLAYGAALRAASKKQKGSREET